MVYGRVDNSNTDTPVNLSLGRKSSAYRSEVAPAHTVRLQGSRAGGDLRTFCGRYSLVTEQQVTLFTILRNMADVMIGLGDSIMELEWFCLSHEWRVEESAFYILGLGRTAVTTCFEDLFSCGRFASWFIILLVDLV